LEAHVRIAVVAPLVTPIHEPQLGGSQAIVADLSAGLAARGHDVDVYAASGSAIEGVRIVDVGVDASVLATSLFRANGARPRTTDASRRAFEAVYATVGERAYDVVHNHAFDAPAVELAAGPVVHTLHLGPDPEIAHALAGTPAVVVCVSQSQRDMWASVARVDEVIRCGVPVERIPWSATAGDAVLYAGRLSPEKGVVEAIEIAAAAGSPIDVVGGAYDEAYHCDLVARFGGRDDVTFRDAMPRTELWQAMSRMRAVLCPVLWDEPFGLVAAEAQAAGTPVIAFDRGALREVIDDGVTGALVPDAEAAVEALRVRFDRRACRRHAERTLSLGPMLDAHEALYERVALR
jgi:glycosyltransferase involved in cell wall biosynthesis